MKLEADVLVALEGVTTRSVIGNRCGGPQRGDSGRPSKGSTSNLGTSAHLAEYKRSMSSNCASRNAEIRCQLDGIFASAPLQNRLAVTIGLEAYELRIGAAACPSKGAL